MTKAGASGHAIRPVRRDQQGRWLAGESPNPGGRPRGIMQYIREATRDGAELVELWLEVLRDTTQDTRDRLICAEELADRGFGKPVQAVLHGGPDGGAIPVALGISQLTDAELVTFIRRGLQAVVVDGAAAALSANDDKATLPTGPDGRES